MIPSDVCPTEDALRAFLEYLVDPLLPAEASQHGSPSLHEQQSVAKQVHSVVILYNYYHRKKCQGLDFLDFASFCKLAVDLRPVLLAYMDFMKRSDRAELTDPESQLSLTERAIMDACDICTRLDSSKETPVIGGWPVSKVTVLLVDSRKENCWLLFGSVAEGVWGMIEKNVDEASLNPESTNKRKRIGKGPVKDDLGIEEDALRRLAFLAVKEAAGIDAGDLLVSESHVVYSLSKENSVSRFYIMQTNIPPKAKVTSIPVKDVIDRLQGPLVTRSTSSWCIAPVVEYFLVLPYAGIMSVWLSREVSLESSQNPKANIGTPNFKPTESEVEVKESTNGSHVGTAIEGSDEKALKQPKKSHEGSPRQVMSCDFPLARHMDVDGVLLPIEDKRRKITGAKQVEPLQEKKIDHMHKDIIALSHVCKQELESELVEPMLRGVPERNGQQNAGVNRTCFENSFDNYRTPSEDGALVIHQDDSVALDDDLAVLASRDKCLTQVARSVILRKRKNLFLQLQKIKDEIAQCGINLRILQKGGEDALVLKLDCLVEASSAPRTRIAHDNCCLTIHTKEELLSEVIRTEKNPPQKVNPSLLCPRNAPTSRS